MSHDPSLMDFYSTGRAPHTFMCYVNVLNGISLKSFFLEKWVSYYSSCLSLTSNPWDLSVVVIASTQLPQRCHTIILKPATTLLTISHSPSRIINAAYGNWPRSFPRNSTTFMVIVYPNFRSKAGISWSTKILSLTVSSKLNISDKRISWKQPWAIIQVIFGVVSRLLNAL